MIRARRLVALSLATVLLWLCLVAIASAATPAAGDRTAALRGSFGTYAGSPRGADGRVDVERLRRVSPRFVEAYEASSTKS